MFENLSSSTGLIGSGTTTRGYYASPVTTALSSFVAIFKIERNDKNEITSAKFIKEMWIEAKNGSSVDFEVAKDPEISKYKAEEISIRTIYTVTF